MSGSLKPLQNPKTIHLFWGFAKVSVYFMVGERLFNGLPIQKLGDFK